MSIKTYKTTVFRDGSTCFIAALIPLPAPTDDELQAVAIAIVRASCA